MRLCLCGCKQEIPDLDKWRGMPRSFIHGHNWRGKSRGGMTEEEKLGATIVCACGCGESITQYRVKQSGHRYKVKFQVGHMWRGKDNHFWKGGLTEESRRFKQSGAYRRWRKAVFERDNYTCQICGARNSKGLGKTIQLHPDHIKPKAIYPELRTEVSNGRTLCADCHRKTDTYGLKTARLLAKSK